MRRFAVELLLQKLSRPKGGEGEWGRNFNGNLWTPDRERSSHTEMGVNLLVSQMQSPNLTTSSLVLGWG